MRLCSFPVVWSRPNYGRGVATSSKRTYTSMLCLPGLLLSAPLTPSRPLSMHASARDAQTLTCRNITLLTTVHIVKAMVFPLVMYRCVSWTMKKAECQRIDTFELWCRKKCMRVPWTARRSNQPILKEINPEYALEDCC